jgi:hypothetical protein
MANENAAWVLEEFIDSLVVELDKTRETLAVKAINKPVSYSVKELSIDLNTFPTYDGDAVKFVTAQPGQQGASKVTIQLGSITDQQVRATSKAPTGKSDVKIDEIAVPKETKKTLRKLGVNSVSDLKELQRKQVDLKHATDGDIDYGALANQIDKARRAQLPPAVTNVSFSMARGETPCLTVKGSNLSIDPAFAPVAVVNGVLANVQSRSPSEIRIELGPAHNLSRRNDVILTVDPFAIIKLNVAAKS